MRSTGRDQASGKKYAMLKSIMISGDTSASSTDNTICPQYGIVAITTYRQGSSLIVQEIEIMRCLGLLSEKSEILLYVRVAADVAIEKIFNMSLDNDIETIIATGDTFRPTPEIPFNSSVEDIRQAVAEYSEFGVPCVITGFPIQQDDEQSPFRQPTEWIESLYANQGRRVPQLACAPSLKSHSLQRHSGRRPQDRGRPQRSWLVLGFCSLNRRASTPFLVAPTIPSPPEWITWLRESFIVPSCLVPHAEGDLLPVLAQRVSLRLFGPELSAFGFFSFTASR